MSPPPLACTVRGCGLPLERGTRVWTCARGHAYDVARSGYVNLLQPQDRRSRAAGDSKEAVSVRARLLAAGVGRASLDAVLQRAVSLPLTDRAVVVDLGSGSGELLAELARRRAITGVGIDLSAAAAEHAARRFPDLTWVVANADRRLPLIDHSVDLVLSLHGRRNPAECARVLTPDGFLIVAVPAPDDLIELRALILGEGVERARVEGVVAEHEPHFTLLERWSVREHRHLERDRLLDLLHGTYRGGRASAAPRIEALGSLDVTLASDCVVLVRREGRS